MFKIVLIARLSVAYSGQTVIAGKSSSANLTLWIVLVAGSLSQSLKNKKYAVTLEISSDAGTASSI